MGKHNEPTTSSSAPNKECESFSIIIPAYNESESLPTLVNQIKEICDTNGLFLRNIVIVDDGSNDGTWDVIRTCKESNEAVVGIRLRRNFGKSTALMAGIEHSDADLIITMDADLQDDPVEIPRFLEKINDGFELVSGWKRLRNDPKNKTITSKIFNYVTARATGIKLHDFNCGYKAYRKEIFDSVKLYGDLHRYIPVLAHALGFKIGEIEVKHNSRTHGKSKYGIGRYMRGYLDLLAVLTVTKYAYRPGHLFGGIGTIILASGSLCLLWLVWVKFFLGLAIGGRPLLFFGVLFAVIGMQMLLFGLLAEMIVNKDDNGVKASVIVKEIIYGQKHNQT
jgi:glycosyltransferase involved in cell wall biosynthesis